MTMKEPDPNELLEILALAKDAAKSARDMRQSITAHAEKWERRLSGRTLKNPSLSNTTELVSDN